MTFDEFYKKYNGRYVDYDKQLGVQCVDLADQYLKDVFGITGVWVRGAREFYTNYKLYPELVNHFERIPNTRDLVVWEGDIVVWSGGKHGHIAIGTGSGDMDYFVSFEENTRGRGEAAHLETHYFNNKYDSAHPVAGVLRARPQYQYLITGKREKYIVILPEGLNIRSKPKIEPQYKTGKVLTPGEIVEIIQIIPETSARSWGKLRDGRGYICMTRYTVRKV